jgi:hypothetical protein
LYLVEDRCSASPSSLVIYGPLSAFQEITRKKRKKVAQIPLDEFDICRFLLHNSLIKKRFRSKKLTSQKQKEANQANAQKSTGPRTADGKSRSALNALKHGLTAKSPVLPDEDPAAYEVFRQQLWDDYQPITGTEGALVEELVGLLWRLRRVPSVEAALLTSIGYQARLDALRQVTEDLTAQDIPIPPVLRLDETGQLDLIACEAGEGTSVSAEGFWHDAVGPKVLDTLGRYETRLANRVRWILGELDRRQSQRVKGEIVG